ncbi:hypothetical protein [Paenibacillus oleatilyticus]|uniref:hypothetical protein n=1 Tax=Paenibacillus oleatilyticus TaxID=2594886 RepID=UPI001C1F73CA|nr:hypothetical protein [Paenibacillus oleatilyticus]MBU7314040.1 hypothetical protein [Paenibacillus oleatilyticus]
MANLPFLVSTYSRNINIFGKERFTARNGFKGIPESYHSDVAGYAARNYYIDDLDRALAEGWINQQEYDNIVSRKTAEDPAYRPVVK